MPPNKTLPQVFIITSSSPPPPGGRKLPIPLEQHFSKVYVSPVERGEDYGAEKMPKIKLAKVLATSFDKLKSFLQPFSLSMLKCQGSLT